MKLRHFLLPVLLGLTSPALAAGGAASDQSAQPGAQVQANLTIYAGGISFGKMDMDTTVTGSDYRSVSNFQTSGVVNAFFQAQIQARSSGKISGKTLAPGLYDSFDI